MLNGIALGCFWKAFTRKQIERRQALHSRTMTGTYRLRNDFCCLFIGECHKQERREKWREKWKEEGKRGVWGDGGLLLCGVTQWLCDSFFLSVVLYIFKRKHTKQNKITLSLSLSLTLSLLSFLFDTYSDYRVCHSHLNHSVCVCVFAFPHLEHLTTLLAFFLELWFKTL